MRSFSKYLLILAVLGLIHCDSTAQVGTTCCPISDAPACCMSFGGSPRDNGCKGLTCDGMPWPSYAGWERRVDDKGCLYWWTPPDAPRGCGGLSIDASDAASDVTQDADALVSDVPASDVVSDVPASDAVSDHPASDVQPDATSDADAPSDADAIACCPISPAPACCMEYGGSPGTFGCHAACDGMPWPNYPGWERRIDANGCPYWWTPPDAPFGCNGFPPEAGGGG